MKVQSLLFSIALMFLSCEKEAESSTGTTDPGILAQIATQGISNSSDFFQFTLNNSIHFDGEYLLEKEMLGIDHIFCNTHGNPGDPDRINWSYEGVNDNQDVELTLVARTEDMTIGTQTFDSDIHRLYVKVFTDSGSGIGGAYEMESGSINLLQHEYDLEGAPLGYVQCSTVMTFQGTFHLWFNEEHTIQVNGVVKSTMD